MKTVTAADAAQNRVLWMLWMKANAPQLYAAALQKTLTESNLSGVGAFADGGTDDNSFALSGLGDSWSDVFDNLVNNVDTLAQDYIGIKGNTSLSASQIATNNARASQGLPPLNANGTVMTVAQMQAAGYTSAQISSIESHLASGSGIFSGSTLMWALIIGGAALAFLALRR